MLHDVHIWLWHVSCFQFQGCWGKLLIFNIYLYISLIYKLWFLLPFYWNKFYLNDILLVKFLLKKNLLKLLLLSEFLFITYSTKYYPEHSTDVIFLLNIICRWYNSTGDGNLTLLDISDHHHDHIATLQSDGSYVSLSRVVITAQWWHQNNTLYCVSSNKELFT